MADFNLPQLQSFRQEVIGVKNWLIRLIFKIILVSSGLYFTVKLEKNLNVFKVIKNELKHLTLKYTLIFIWCCNFFNIEL